MQFPFWESVHSAIVPLDYLLADSQAHSDPVWVLISCALDFAEKFKEFLHLILPDTLALVNDIDAKSLLDSIESRLDRDFFAGREFECILCQVD